MPDFPKFPYEEQFARMFRFDGKVALVAGGYGGIGSTISHGLAQLGATVAIAGPAVDKGNTCVESIRGRGYTSPAPAKSPTKGSGAARAQAFALGFEITEPESIATMVDDMVKQAGKVDILVNCVGMHIEKPAEDYTVEDWDRVNSVNLRGAFLLSQAVGRQMIRQGSGGKHIHVSSVRSMLGIRRGYISYCATKGGMNLMVKQLATEWARHQINVNAIAPTFIRTDLVKHYLEDREFYTALVNRIPLGRLGETINVAGAALFLASSASDFITGHVLFVDGGVTASQ